MPMNCDQAIEFLPWLLNGTLEATERDEVRRHLATCERCRAALNDTRDAWTIFAQHLPGDALVALAYGEIPADVDPAVAERHLATCPECAAELELARMSHRLEEDERIATFPAKTVRDTGREYRTWRGGALAAGLAGLIAFGGWFHAAQRSGLVSELEARNQAIQQQQAKLETEIKGIRSSMSQLTRPRLNTLAPEFHSDVVRGQNGASIPANQIATPLLYADPAVPSPERAIAILDESGLPVWQDTGLRRTSESSGPQYFTITLLPGFLKPGQYTIQLYSNENGQRVKRESYKIRVE
jgi:anti-sigma factor RsiW